MNIWINTTVLCFGKQAFSRMLLHLLFITAPGQIQGNHSNVIWSLDKLRIWEDRLTSEIRTATQNLCAVFFMLGSHCLKRLPNHREKYEMIPSYGHSGAFGLLGKYSHIKFQVQGVIGPLTEWRHIQPSACIVQTCPAYASNGLLWDIMPKSRVTLSD